MIPECEKQAAYEYLAAQAHCEEEAERFEDDIRDHLRRMHRNDTPDNRAIVFRHTETPNCLLYTSPSPRD